MRKGYSHTKIFFDDVSLNDKVYSIEAHVSGVWTHEDTGEYDVFGKNYFDIKDVIEEFKIDYISIESIDNEGVGTPVTDEKEVGIIKDWIYEQRGDDCLDKLEAEPDYGEDE